MFYLLKVMSWLFYSQSHYLTLSQHDSRDRSFSTSITALRQHVNNFGHRILCARFLAPDSLPGQFLIFKKIIDLLQNRCLLFWHPWVVGKTKSPHSTPFIHVKYCLLTFFILQFFRSPFRSSTSVEELM